MISVTATKKLLAKLPLSEEGFLPHAYAPEGMTLTGEQQKAGQAESLLSGWHAHLFTLQRRNCALFVHNGTRFPLFIPSLTKPGFASIDWHFQNALMNTLLEVGAGKTALQRAKALMGPLHFESGVNRSVQGTLNQMKNDLEYSLWFNDTKLLDVPAQRLSAWLANRPCTMRGGKDFVWPMNAMTELLGGEPKAKRSVKPLEMATSTSAEVIELNRYRK